MIQCTVGHKLHDQLRRKLLRSADNTDDDTSSA